MLLNEQLFIGRQIIITELFSHYSEKRRISEDSFIYYRLDICFFKFLLIFRENPAHLLLVDYQFSILNFN